MVAKLVFVPGRRQVSRDARRSEHRFRRILLLRWQKIGEAARGESISSGMWEREKFGSKVIFGWHENERRDAAMSETAVSGR